MNSYRDNKGVDVAGEPVVKDVSLYIILPQGGLSGPKG